MNRSGVPWNRGPAALLALLVATSSGCSDCGKPLPGADSSGDAAGDAGHDAGDGRTDAGTDSGPCESFPLCPATEPVDGGTPPTLSADIQPLLTANCVSMMCHAMGGLGAGMWLESGMTWANTVGVPAGQLTETSMLNRIEPGLPALSYLVRKLQGTHLCPEVGGTGMVMPASGMCLDPVDVGRVRAWIEAGALDD